MTFPAHDALITLQPAWQKLVLAITLFGSNISCLWYNLMFAIPHHKCTASPFSSFQLPSRTWNLLMPRSCNSSTAVPTADVHTLWIKGLLMHWNHECAACRHNCYTVFVVVPQHPVCKCCVSQCVSCTSNKAVFTLSTSGSRWSR